MDLFDVYLDDFRVTCERVKELIDNLPLLTEDAFKNAEKEINYEINEANQIIESINVVAHNTPNKQQVEEAVVLCKQKVKELKSLLKEASIRTDRIKLLGNGNSTDDTLPSLSARSSLLQDNQKLENGIQTIDYATSTVYRARDTGKTSLDTLVMQRDQLLGQQTRLERMQDKLKNSLKMITTIAFRMSVNDMLKVAIVCALIFFTALIIYLRWIHRAETYAWQPPESRSGPSSKL
ncbi:uncharacterized protein LOC126315419 [Schistocerca gregaria]|uniref:uncharacterized protein LOC126315419 n=1 Tax=Schistocerca gregaria TaxID=7010 RepID=UPI00211DB462|nr:uncharacterized protein LOC126315419 [Schistocerca gregaria]